MAKEHKPNFKRSKDDKKKNTSQNNKREEFAQEQGIELYEQDVYKVDDKGNKC